MLKEQRKCYIMRGYPGSGKSTMAKEISSYSNATICSADHFFVDRNGKYNFDQEKLSQAHFNCFANFKNCVLNGVNVIVDNTNLKYSDVKKYIDFLLINNNQNDFIYSIELVEVTFNSIEKAIELRKDNQSGKNIPEDKMNYMYKSFKNDIRPLIIKDFKNKISLGELDNLKNELPFTINTDGKIDAVICDLDGTLSLFQYTNGVMIRDSYDASKCNADIINVPVANVLRSLQNNYSIIFVSGREDKFREQTIEFLDRVFDEYGVVYSDLYMRKTGDFRSDTIIKKEIYDNELNDKYHIMCVFDDRPKVVKMWRSLGLFVFDCNFTGKDF